MPKGLSAANRLKISVKRVRLFVAVTLSDPNGRGIRAFLNAVSRKRLLTRAALFLSAKTVVDRRKKSHPREKALLRRFVESLGGAGISAARFARQKPTRAAPAR
jgi:hypothetical protein